MNNVFVPAAVAALLFSSFAGLSAQSTWYVRKHPTSTSPTGTQQQPFNSLAQVQAASKAGDTIMVMAADEKQGPLDGGITLKPGQKLLGMGPKVTQVPPPAMRAWVTNKQTASRLGAAVVLADNNEVAGLHIGDSLSCAVRGDNVTGANLHDLLVTNWNTSAAQSVRTLFGNFYSVPGVYFFMLGNDTTKKSHRCVDCVFDNGQSAAVGISTNNKTRAELLIRGSRVVSNGDNAFWMHAFDTAEAKLVVEDCDVDNVAQGKFGVGAWGEGTPRAELHVDGLRFQSSKNLAPRRGVEMSFNGGATLVFNVVNSTIRDTNIHAILALSWRNYTTAKATLDFHAENNVVTGAGGGISCGAWDSGDLSKLRATIKNNVIDNRITAGNGSIEIFCGLNSSTVDDAVVAIDSNRVANGSNGIVYSNEGFGANSMMVTNNVIRNAGLAGIFVFERGTAPQGSVVFANNLVSQSKNAGIEVDGGSPTFVNNTSTANGTHGLYTKGAAPQFINGILWGNTSGGIWADGFPKPGASYSNVQGGYSGTGNLNTDPLFVDGANCDYHLRHDSPCKNRGSNAALASITTDFEGDPRVADAAVDMGADEFFTHLYYTGNPVPNGTIKVNAIGNPNLDVLLGISGAATVLNPPVAVPGLGGLLLLRSPILILPLGKTAKTGVAQLSIKVPASFPKLTAMTQALIGTRFSNPSAVTVQ